MSSYHVMSITADGLRASVVFHIPVPDENNFAGINLQAAVKAHLETENPAGITARVPWNIGNELGNIQNGAVYEIFEAINFNEFIDNAQKRNIVDARWRALKTTIQEQLRARLKFWGFNRDVP